MLLVFVPKCYFTFAKIILSTICNFTVASTRLIFEVMAPPFVTISTFVDQNPGHGTRNLGVQPRLLPLRHQLGVLETALRLISCSSLF